MKLKNIDILKGKLLIFGGVYSNFQALEELINIAEYLQIPPTNIICTGDIVGYCAQPEECVQLIKEWGIHCITGNVELQLAAGENECGCNFEEDSRCDGFSKMWYPYAQNSLSEDSLNWIKTLPEFLEFTYEGISVGVVHGSYFDTSEFIFKSTPWETKQKTFDALKVDVILAGHCGLPFEDNNEAENQFWVNAGVIGMPANNGKPAVWYHTIDSQEGHFYWEMDYDFETAAALMEAAGLPQEYAQTLRTGIWDNCEILPDVETALQGKPIEFT